MGRLHGIREIEDFPWLPAVLRDAVTSFLRTITAVTRPFDGAAPVLRELLPLASLSAAASAAAPAQSDKAPPPAQAAASIVDLCSGGGGALVDLMARPGLLPEDCTACLTDLYPNDGALSFLERALPGRVEGVRTPVDATAVPPPPAAANGGGRVRTIFNALHHLPPAVVEAVMRDAAAAREPFAAFEVVERHPAGLLVMMLAMPLAPLLLGPLVRPLTLSGLFFTYIIPAVPFLAACDGFLSCLRAYSVEELEALCAKANAEAPGGGGAYEWRVGVAPREARGLAPFRLVWLEGRPVVAPAVRHAPVHVVAQGHGSSVGGGE